MMKTSRCEQALQKKGGRNSGRPNSPNELTYCTVRFTVTVCAEVLPPFVPAVPVAVTTIG